ncbi:MAG TPA: metalloregulator ArsR/SmtB family transcription factor [Roseiarcus sp.]|nr:metalloregulator ArsR/SmtB family transcription factor [Roseiarcus sp.]
MKRADSLSATFSALADPTRRAIVAALALGEATVGELALPFPISGPAISRHLRVLAEAGLIERKASARWRICSLRPDPIRDAHDWLSAYRRYWEESLDRLAELVEQPKRPQRTRSLRPKNSERGRSK